MRMIAKLESRSEAEERAAFLRSRGIATLVTDMTSMRMNLAHQGRFRAALWAVLEDRHADAESLLENPDHDVVSPLSADQMKRLETEGASQARKSLIKWMLLIAVGLMAAAWMVINANF